MEKVYSVSDLAKLISESSTDFKAKLGNGVEKENKENNGKAYRDATKRAKDYDGGLSDEKKKKYEKVDNNRTTLDYQPENVTDDWKERVHAQVKGYSSKQEMNNGIEKGGVDFSNNDNIYQGMKKRGEEIQNNQKTMARSGLQSHNLPEKYFDRKNMYESQNAFDMRQMINVLNGKINKENVQETKSVKTVFFKKTEFLTEEHMLSKIPDDFKVEGSVFKMKDKNDDIYLVEWKNNKGYILEHTNKNKLNEDFNKINHLIEYKTSDSNTTVSQREKTESDFKTTLNNIRKLM